MLFGMMYGFPHGAALTGSANVPVAEVALGWFMPVVLAPAGLAERVPSLRQGANPGDLGTMKLNALEHITPRQFRRSCPG
ncbi:hypothetical protein SMC26_34595 [Actinomadura fulvescens]